MLPATNRGVGMHIGFPDVCLTPVGPAVVPIPYPNFAMTAQAAVFSPIVKVSGVHALNLGSMIPMTFGDEAGVAHWTIKGPGRYIMGNPIVFVDRLPAINLTCPTTGNTANNALGAVLVPSAVNVFYTYAHATPDVVAPNVAAALGDQMLGRSQEAPISWTMLDDATGYVRIELVTSDITSRFHVALMELERTGARALVIDLRGCPGGDLDGIVELSSCFLNEGAEIVRIQDADGDELIRRATLPAAYTMPLAVLIDEGTASAAEVFVACMKAHGRARILGRATYGKSTVQHFVPGQTTSFDYPTVARCLAPGQTAIDARGVEPEKRIELDAGEASWIDAALNALMSYVFFFGGPNPP